MWIPRKKLKTLVQTMNDLEKQISSLEKDSQDWKLVRLKTELNYEFCKSVAHANGLSFLSYQQLNSPTADSCEKVRMLFNEIRELA